MEVGTMSYDIWMEVDAGGPEPVSVTDSINHTSNTYAMWERALGFSLRELNGRMGAECIPLLESAIGHMRDPRNRISYQHMNPANGWGSHDSATAFLEDFLRLCERAPKALVRIWA